ncbi:carboxypeptidase regulatory-like domain-containing protein [Bacteroides sp. UBA939]|uniref:carboxypeptidase regulatory-like domain-containing protein n=1 Tax=Bacteroides sp. UBA939 TaxID=1946092 RepID=UPI0025C6FBF1|nr:carboxypeptidase regulatory-like domain-containing protein [Bacteroides sp. UBA939]
MKLVDVSKLQESLVIYDKALRTLPYATLKEVAAILKLNVRDLQGKHSLINERRRAGGTQSYKIGKEFKEFEQIFGYEPSLIEPKDVVFITRENSQKYDDNELLIIGGTPVNNITKKHPMETKIVFGLTTSHAEDVVYSLFHAERDEDSKSPSGAFDGYFTKADKLIVSGAVNAARGNLAISGEFAMPVNENDYSAYENLVDWIGGAHNSLRNSQGGIPQLMCAETVIKAARAALRNKLKMQEYPSVARMVELLREDAFCSSLEVVTHEALGRGSRLIMQKAGNMDLAFNTQAAAKFCQIRDIYPDPNEWQFWLQAGYDTRINDWHEKVFRTNEQKNESNDLAGDYCLTGAVQVNITGTDAGTWTIDGKTSTRSNGQYFIGLTPGNHTIVFKDVDGKTKPNNQEVTVAAGKVVAIDAQYT